MCACVSTDYVSGGEMFTHLYQRDHFPEEAVRIYIGEIILALEHLHKVGVDPSSSVTSSYNYRQKKDKHTYRDTTPTYHLLYCYMLMC